MSDLDFLNIDLSAASTLANEYGVLPAGEYTATINAAEVQATKAGTGRMIYVRLDVTGPTRAGAVVFDRMLVVHPNPTAQEIGIARFSALCRALGFSSVPKDSKELIGKSVGMKTKVRQSEQYGDSAEVVEYFKPKSGAASAPAANIIPDDVPF